MSTSPWYPDPPLMPGDDGYDAKGSIERGVDPELAHAIGRRYAELDREEIEATLADERPKASVTERFRSGRDLVNAAPEEIDYVLRPWCAMGTITELDGKPKAAGKTTFVLHAVRAVLDGKPFLGESVVWAGSGAVSIAAPHLGSG